MTTETLRHFFGWCAVINYVLLLIWCALTFWLPGWAGLVTRWFGLTENEFKSMNYAGIMYYKLGIILFTLVPYLALRIIG